MSAPRHLLVRLPNPLGDAVMATPALRGLRRALPDTRITWAGRRAALAALDGLTERDAVLPVSGPFARGWRAPLRTGRLWRSLAPDAVLLLAHSFSSALAAWRSGAARRTGWRGRHRALLLTERVDLPRDGRDLAPRAMPRMYLDLAAPYGAADDGEGARVASTPYDRRRAERRLEAAGLVETRLLAVSPGASYGPSKVYPPPLLAKVVARVRDEHGLHPLLLCAPGEEDLARETAAAIRGPAHSTHEDPPDVGELKALLEQSEVLLTTDAGPRHLARALGVATAVVMGPTDPRWSEGDGAVVVRKEDLDCLGCHHRVCPIEHPCMRDLHPELVAETVSSLVDAR